METISFDDMRLFAAVAQARGFTAAAEVLGVPKQTLSRRVAALETALGVRLMHRTTRRLVLSPLGAAYAARCAELVRLAAWGRARSNHPRPESKGSASEPPRVSRPWC